MHPSRGFTLIEIIVSVALIGLIVTATTSLLQRVSVNEREIGNKSLALRIARNEVEQLRAAGYAALPASGSFTDSLLSSLPSGSGVIAVTTVDAKTKQLVVTVSWTGESGARSTSLTTLIAENSQLK